MYTRLRSLWNKCVIRDESHDCDYWPEECEECLLVEFYLVKLPRCWKREEMDVASKDDLLQLHQLLMEHLKVDCRRGCTFCAIERIPI